MEALALHHGTGTTVENLGFLLDLGGLSVLHVGDTQADADEVRALGLGDRRIDVAFIPFWYVLNEQWRPVVQQVIRPRHLIVMHVPQPGANDAYLDGLGGREGLVEKVRRNFPDAVFFDTEMQSRIF